MLNYILGFIKNIFNPGKALFCIVDSKSHISRKAKTHRLVKLINSSINDFSYIGQSTWIMHADIGKFCSIAGSVRIGLASHTLHLLSTSPIFTEKRNATGHSWLQNSTKQSPWEKVRIGNDVWIGTRSLILGGVNVGNGAVIGAGSIVTKDVPAYAVVAGVPAKIIRYRFSEEEIKLLENIQWWNLPENYLKSNIKLFQNKDVSSSIIQIENEFGKDKLK